MGVGSQLKPTPLNLGHTLKTPEARLAPAGAPLLTTASPLTAASPFAFLSPRGLSDSAQGQVPNLAITAGSALRVWLWSPPLPHNP